MTRIRGQSLALVPFPPRPEMSVSLCVPSAALLFLTLKRTFPSFRHTAYEQGCPLSHVNSSGTSSASTGVCGGPSKPGVLCALGVLPPSQYATRQRARSKYPGAVNPEPQDLMTIGGQCLC